MFKKITNVIRKWRNEIITKCSFCSQPLRRKDYRLGRVIHRSSYDLGTHKTCYNAWWNTK